MDRYFLDIMNRSQKRGILLDANLLVLYFMGLCDVKQIANFKRTKIFTQEDYDTLIYILVRFTKIITTPNILTEVSNLAGQLTYKLKDEYFRIFASQVQIFDEHHCCSAEITRDPAFIKFGLTDIGISIIARERCLVLTTDASLYQYLHSVGVDVINFNHIRPYNWK